MRDSPLNEKFAASLFFRRFSCRRFGREPVSDEALAYLLEAARWAPSAGNLQPWRFVVVREAAVRAALASAAARQRFVGEAPVLVVVCAVPAESARGYGERGASLYCLQDTAAAVENLLLAATELGLGSCWVGAFDERRVASVLGLEEGVRPVALVPIGTPAEEAPPRSRRPWRETVRFV